MDAELQKKINIRSARGWKPTDGQTLIGTVAHIDRRSSDYGDYPAITLAADTDDPEASEYIAVHAFHSTLKSALFDLKPKVGDRLAITYHGQVEGKRKDPKTGLPVKYHSYTAVDPDVVDEDMSEQDAADFWADAVGF